jgi:hypothetical protein
LRSSGTVRATLGLFLFFQALYALTSSGNAFRIPDEFEVYFQTETLVDHGDLSVPQTLQIRSGGQPIFFGKVGLDGKPYAPYGPLAAVLAVPHHLAGRALARLLGIERVPQPQGLAWVIFVGGITMLTTATGAALAVAGFHRAAIALGTPSPVAIWLSLLLGGATVLWTYGTSFYTEAWQAATMIWAAALLIEARAALSTGRGAAASGVEGRVVAAALLLTATGLIKATSLVFLPAFLIAVLADGSMAREPRFRVAAILAAGIGVAGITHAAWNTYRFGSMFDFGYNWTETIPALPPRAFAITDVPRGLFVLLATPGKSLFLWAPILVLSVMGAASWWRRDRAFTLGVGAAAAIGLVFYAAYLFPEGGYAHGPRHLVPIVPLVALLAAGPAASRWPPAVLTACAVVGIAVVLPATMVSFLEDQALRRDPAGRPVPGYYDVIDPAPGRPNNRYRPGYIPFVTAMSNPDWASEKAPLGMGPDYFLMHLQQARRQLPDGRNIPESFDWWWPALWLAIGAGGAVMVWRAIRQPGDTKPAPGPAPVPPVV